MTLTPEKRAKFMAVLNKHFPKFEYSYMDGAFYWKSLEQHEKGDIIEHDGNRYMVRYSWGWWPVLHDVTVYMAELEPVGEFIKTKETSGPYDPS